MSPSAESFERRDVFRNPFEKAPRRMWVILLEIGLAIGLAAFIVWWTRPIKRDWDDSGAGTEKEKEKDEAER